MSDSKLEKLIEWARSLLTGLDVVQVAKAICDQGLDDSDAKRVLYQALKRIPVSQVIVLG